MGASFGNLSEMLGGKPETVEDANEANGKVWKTNIKVVRALVAYAIETGRLV